MYCIVIKQIKKVSERAGIVTGELYADQHLLAFCFYNSALTGKPARIFTRDKHPLMILSEGWGDILNVLPRDNGSAHVEVYKVNVREGDYVTFSNKVKKGRYYGIAECVEK